MILLITAAVFWPVVGFQFTGYDDNDNVGQNPDMNPVTAASVAKYWRGPHMDMYIPVAYTTWAGLAAVARTETAGGKFVLDPSVFHLANVLVHMGSAVLLYRVLRRLIELREGIRAPRAAEWAAAAGAAIFAVHPLQVEPVAWVSGMRDVLGGLLAMTAVWLYVEAVAAGGGRERRWLYAGGLLAFGLSMLSKPSAMSLPVALAAIDWLILRRRGRRVVETVLPWLVVAGVVAVMTKVLQPASALVGAPLWARPMIALDALGTYAAKVLAPWKLGIDYGRSPRWLMGQSMLWWSWVPAAVAMAVLAWRWRRWPVPVAAGAVFVAMLLPVLGLVKFDFQWHSTVADRYAYLAMIGVGIGVAFALRRRPSRAAAIAVWCAVGVYAARSYAQVWTWRDSKTLFAHAIEVNPTSLAGNTWWGMYEGTRGRVDQAIPYFRTALAAHPGDPVASYAFGELMLHLGEPAEAVSHLRYGTSGRGEWNTYLALATALEQSGDGAGATEVCRNGVRRHPNEPKLHEMLGALLAQQGDWAAAREAYVEAVRLNPKAGSARAAMAEVERRLQAASRPATP